MKSRCSDASRDALRGLLFGAKASRDVAVLIEEHPALESTAQDNAMTDGLRLLNTFNATK